MKGLSVLVTMLLFAAAIALSNYLRKTGAIPQETHGYSLSQSTLNYGVAHNPGAMASLIRNTRQYRN